jgi:putative endonuclease
MSKYFVYIMASDSGTLYVGYTNNLLRRAREHKGGYPAGFTKKYGCHKLVYYEKVTDLYHAEKREQQIKNWRREKKQFLIGSINPGWVDLYANLKEKGSLD